MNYQFQVNKVIEYIGKHFDEKMTLSELSEIACFSKYHFHRIFTAYTGLSLQQYIRWLRLKRAAYQLLINKDQSIINIAMDAGFESHEAFSRVFKQICGVNPSEFRNQNDWLAWDKLPYLLQVRGEISMQVIIKNVHERRLAIVEHRGDASLLIDSINKLMNWINSQSNGLKLQGGEAFGFAYDDPKVTPAAEFRFDLGITVTEQLSLSGDIIEKKLPAGRYAIALHKGSHDNIGDTVYALYRNWLPQSGEELADLPCIFCYHNFAHEVAETELLTECWLLLK